MSWTMTLEELVQGTGGALVSSRANSFSGVGTDTRAVLKGKIFVALKGENFDAHDFLEQALAQGAAAIVAHRWPMGEALETLKAGATLVKVDDTLRALQNLARFWRRKQSARILALTGSNGKTTTKEFTAAILSHWTEVQYSKGSFNNHWGVPISLLSISPEHSTAVIEMGMNHLGEIRELVAIAEPDVVAVTMVGQGHLEGVGSIEGVARAKEEIYADVPRSATRIFNLDNPWTGQMYARALAGEYKNPGPLLTFASDEHAGKARVDVCFRLIDADATSIRIAGRIGDIPGEARVPVFGAHNVTNLMLAASFAMACGMMPDEIWAALPDCRNGWGRNQWIKLASGGHVLFDAYNANPESMRSAVENFSRLSVSAGGRKIAVLGEMREMGASAPQVHRELGERAARSGFDLLVFIGPSGAEFAAGAKAAGFQKNIVVFDSYEHFLASEGGPVIDPTDIVLVKGSRGMQLERVVQSWNPLDFGKKATE